MGRGRGGGGGKKIPPGLMPPSNNSRRNTLPPPSGKNNLFGGRRPPPRKSNINFSLTISQVSALWFIIMGVTGIIIKNRFLSILSVLFSLIVIFVFASRIDAGAPHPIFGTLFSWISGGRVTGGFTAGILFLVFAPTILLKLFGFVPIGITIIFLLVDTDTWNFIIGPLVNRLT